MRTDLFTNPKKALFFAGAIIFGVIMTVDSHSGDTAFESTPEDSEYMSGEGQNSFFGQRELVQDEAEQGDSGVDWGSPVEDFGDDSEGYEPEGEDVSVPDASAEIETGSGKPSPYAPPGGMGPDGPTGF